MKNLLESGSSKESKEDKYFRARERVRLLKRFYGKIASYLFFNAFLAGLNYYGNQWDNMWFLWITFFWGIGLIIEAGKVFGLQALLGKNWEARKIKELMDEDDHEVSSRSRWE